MMAGALLVGRVKRDCYGEGSYLWQTEMRYRKPVKGWSRGVRKAVVEDAKLIQAADHPGNVA